MAPVVQDVAIIGGGLGGCVLAIALHQQGIGCRIYELRPESDLGLVASGVGLHVNGSKAADDLGILARVQEGAFKVEQWSFVNDKDETTRVQKTGAMELYGYANHRLHRRVLLAEMKVMLKEYGVPILYDSRFDGIVSETHECVTFKINGAEETASMLVGSDGIHSRVRSYLTPLVPEYNGTLVVIAHIPTDSVEWPYEGFPLGATIQGKPCSLMMISENSEGTEIMVGKQFDYPEQTREGWDALASDTEKMAAFFREDYDDWHPTARSIIDSVDRHRETMLIWPYRKMPSLERWSSPLSRVVIMGDAAHAIPPSSGQGATQAFEDAHTLALLLGGAGEKTDLGELLKFWRDWRQARIDQVLLNMAVTDVTRMTREKRERLEREGKLKDLPSTPEALQELVRKIYTPTTKEDMAAWIKEHS